ncbi:fibroblast growth factor receptor 3-like isoform X2 [Ptychodera flava]|uniref:fibroblast growth factor receptor 3-like isoform X2 n=1 Tax=Ptychodera flava TaxID=63121 RepID=UPI00396A0066
MKSMHRQCPSKISKVPSWLVLFIVTNVSQQVLGEITWKTVPTNTTVREGESVTLYCAVTTDGNNIYLPEWYKEIPNSSGERLITDTGRSYDDCCIVTGDQTNGEVNLRFESVRLEDEGKWICRSPRTVDDQTRYAHLTVVEATSKTSTSNIFLTAHPYQEIPEPTEKQEIILETQKRPSPASKPIWDEVPSHTIAREGQPTTLHCKVTNYSGHVLPEWFKQKEDGTLLHVTSGGASYSPGIYVNRSLVGQADLVIDNANKTNEGTWICRIPDSTIEGDLRQMSANLIVLDDDPHCVKVSGVGPNGEVIIGSTVELQCSIGSRATEFGNLVWTRNGIDTNKRSLNPLKFSKIVKVKDDGARFNCRLNHSTVDYPWTCNEDIVFQVQYPPTTVRKHISVCVKRGDILNLTCPYIERNPQVTSITWKLPEKYHVADRLIVENIGQNMTSPIRYSCTAESTFFNGDSNQIQIEFVVDIQYEPEVSTYNGSKIQVDEGDDLTIDCLVDSNPPSLITWIRPDGSSVQNSTLVINRIQRTENGIYNCSAVNRLCPELGINGTGNSLIQVMVMYPPTALNKIKNSKSAADKGEVAILMCEIESYPESSIQWIRSNGDVIEYDLDVFIKEVHLSDFIRVSQLHINNTDPSRDYGVYVCISSNEKGTLAFNVTLHGKSKPDPVVNVHFKVSENAILVSWTPGFNGGQEQSFITEYWKTPGGNERWKIHTNASMCTIINLEPYTTYSIRVISFNHRGNSSSEEYDVITMASRTSTVMTSPSSAASPVITHIIAVAVILPVILVIVVTVALFIRKKRQNVPVEEVPMVATHEYEDVESTHTLTYQPSNIGNITEYESPVVFKSTLLPLHDRSNESAQPEFVPEDPYMKCGEHAFEVNNNQTWLKKIIHSGTFYDVHKADAWFIAGQDGVTSVVIKKAKDMADMNSESNLKSEIEMMKSIPENPNVVQLLATCTKPGNPTYLIMEFANYGDLKTFLVFNRKRMTSVNDHHKQFLSFVIDVAKGMRHLADQNVLHRCLCAKHVLVFKKDGAADWMCKISNFGYARNINEPGKYAEMERKSDYRWTASEVLMNEQFSLASDVWSYGVLMWEIFTVGQVPYEEISEAVLIEEYLNGYRLDCPNNCPNNIFTIMLSCWDPLQESRPLIDSLVKDLEIIK